MDKTGGQIAYEAFEFNFFDPVSWKDLPRHTKIKWEAVAQAVADSLEF